MTPDRPGARRAAAALAGLLLAGAACGQPSALPSLGDRISGAVSLEREYRMGQQFLSRLRRGAPTIPDALLNDYLENVTYRLASRSQLQDHRLSFVIIDSEEINAFAAPGGVIGVNTGLFLRAGTEAEFASVVSHEIAHVSQRHFARGVDEAQTGRLGQLAAVLAGILVMATSDGGHGAAAISAAQGLAASERLRFSRSNETEADRVGQDTMFNAGYDPAAQALMYERLLAQNRFGRRPPEFLLTHPLTESRIADSRGRAARYPRRDYRRSLEYQAMRARVVGHYAPDKAALADGLREELEAAGDAFSRDAARYALTVALWENEEFAAAARTLAPLLERDPNRISYVVTQAEIYTRQNEPGLAMAFLKRHLEINPDNHPLTMAYADALVASRSYSEAARMMERHAGLRRHDHHLWYRLAETWGQAGNISKVHQARAEYFTLVGDYRQAREQLMFALRIETEAGAGPAVEARLRHRVREVERLRQARELEN